MELERFPKAMPLREGRDACRGGEEALSALGDPRHPVSTTARRAAWLRALTRPPGRSGGTSDTMAWLEGSLLLLVAGRLPPALLDMSKVGLWHRSAVSTATFQEPDPPNPHPKHPNLPLHALSPPRSPNQGRWAPTYFCKSSLEFSSGTWPVTGCRNVFRLSLWLQGTARGEQG